MYEIWDTSDTKLNLNYFQSILVMIHPLFNDKIRSGIVAYKFENNYKPINSEIIDMLIRRYRNKDKKDFLRKIKEKYESSESI